MKIAILNVYEFINFPRSQKSSTERSYLFEQSSFYFLINHFLTKHKRVMFILVSDLSVY